VHKTYPHLSTEIKPMASVFLPQFKDQESNITY